MNRTARLAAYATVLVALIPATADAQYDFDNGNAPIEVVITNVVPVIFQDISPSGGDATLILRTTTLITNAWFDGTAPYHPTAVGVYSRLGRRPVSERTTRNINIAAVYASYRLLNSFLPHRAGDWRAMMINAGLDPDDNSTDLTTAIGIGNVAGTAVAVGRQNDGMNQLGNEGGRDFNKTPYADYTGYKPINTAYDLYFPSHWQPDLQRQGIGLYKIQQFVTPQYRYVEPYSYPSASAYGVPLPINNIFLLYRRYKAQADDVLQQSANLDDVKKLKAELFDNKIDSLGFSAVFAALSQGLSLLEFIQLDFLTNMAAFDAGIVVWQEKEQWDGVRPFSAIRKVYGNQLVTAWGGPGQGTVQLPANEWRSYLEEADHPEYPSASTCFCHAHAQSARLFLGTDNLGYPVVRAAGSSRVEPGLVPAQDTTIVFPTWTAFADDCGQSRVWAGVHFQAAIDASAALCDVFGDTAYAYMQSLLDGTAPVRGPSAGTGP